jgi:hypothetical protein
MKIERLFPLSCGSLNQELADFDDEFFPYIKKELLSRGLNIMPRRQSPGSFTLKSNSAPPITNGMCPAPIRELRNSGGHRTLPDATQAVTRYNVYHYHQGYAAERMKTGKVVSRL